MPKKGRKNRKSCFSFIFQGHFKNAVFVYVSLITKKIWAILEFFFNTDWPFYRPVPTLYIKKIL